MSDAPEGDDAARLAPDHVVDRWRDGRVPVSAPDDLPVPPGVVDASEVSDHRFVMLLWCPLPFGDVLEFFETSAEQRGYSVFASLERVEAPQAVGHVIFDRAEFSGHAQINDYGPFTRRDFGFDRRRVTLIGYPRGLPEKSLKGAIQSGLPLEGWTIRRTPQSWR